MSVNFSYSWIDKAQIDGGLEFGLAHSDYSPAEIEECLEANASMDLGNKIAQEQANRLVRAIGTITGNQAVAGGEAAFNDGRRMKTKLNWTIAIGDFLVLWVKNSSGIIYSSGSSVSVLGECWVKP